MGSGSEIPERIQGQPDTFKTYPGAGYDPSIYHEDLSAEAVDSGYVDSGYADTVVEPSLPEPTSRPSAPERTIPPVQFESDFAGLEWRLSDPEGPFHSTVQASDLALTQGFFPEYSSDLCPLPPETSVDSGYADTLDDSTFAESIFRSEQSEFDSINVDNWGGPRDYYDPGLQFVNTQSSLEQFQGQQPIIPSIDYLNSTPELFPAAFDFGPNYSYSHFDHYLIGSTPEFESSHFSDGQQHRQYQELQGLQPITPRAHSGPEDSTIDSHCDVPPKRLMPASGSKRKRANEQEMPAGLMSHKGSQFQRLSASLDTQTERASLQLSSQSSASDENGSLASDSKETDITRSDTEHDSIDSGIIEARNLDHLLNSTRHFDELDQLERDTVRLLDMEVGPDLELDTVDDCIVHLKRLRMALANLNKQQFCGSSMNILVEDQSKENVAKALPVMLEGIKRFLDASTQFNSNLLNQRTKDWIQSILGSNEADTLDLDLLDSLRILCSILSIGLVAFSGSHVCRFDVTNWGQQMERIPIGLDQYAFRARKLACLDDFIGGPAWVLGKTEGRQTAPENTCEKETSQSASPDDGSKLQQPLQDSNDEPRVHPGMKVSLSVQDFDELWGPISLVGGSPDSGLAIRTERGFIVPLPRDQQSELTSDDQKVECHWTSEIPQHVLESRANEEGSGSTISLDIASRILIGTGTNAEIGLFVNEKCKSSIALIQQQIACRLQYPGTCNSKYVKEGLDLQFVGGQYITGGLVKKYKRMPKRTLKAMLIEDCKKPDTRLVPLLGLRVGLEVSACTGNAQRVTLWDALRLSQTGPQTLDAVPYCEHKIGDRHCISTCWTRCHSSDEIDSFEDQPIYGKPLNGPQARRVIINSILALEHTGLDSEGNLQVAWPFSDIPANCPVSPSTAKESNNWFRVVKETRETSSFPVFSQQCLEFHDRGLVRSCSASCRTKNARPPHTMLSTQLLNLATGVPMLGLFEGASFLVGEAHLTVTKTVQGQLAIVAIVSSNPLAPLRRRFREFLPDPPTHGFKENIRPDIAAGLSIPLYVH
ncbi:uncharacterized protein N7506_008121 [Penicillium brevicompactum]|uniref:uncharacterized protein n=1 Tax=Penicillium brevicompactum TaxID=5074 RepID=UPI00254105A3|nr:uncharacterized protein N7506_008121 [Penicillium brevicompactum]KAJ5334338.1 hypothetical protein N7506_008121 [Penicillium brevicompactum]